MNFPHATAIAILAAVAACKPSEQRAAAGDTEQAGTQAAPAAAAAAAPEPAAANPQGTAGWTQVTAVRGFDSPESVWYDSTLDVYFVSNTGSGDGDDSHGFISRLKSDGNIDSLRFIADGQNGVTLHTPRGLAVLGDTIWVADGKTLRGFDKRSGKGVGDVDFSQLDAELLNDVAIGPDGSVFITDTRARNGDGEIFSVPELTVEGRSRNPQRSSTNTTLKGPNGITWDRVRGRYLVASFLGNDIYSWMPKAEPATIATGPGRFDGIAALGDGRILVTSWNDSSLMILRRDSLQAVITGLPEPADIGIDNKRQRVAIPLSASNEVVIFTIPPATAGREVPRKVTR
ncbi:MAG TPA: hypothetical protein VFK04_07425 [Gemmatimonadaceae bacterium]|nr:hypothetical protein [Gemmatimonadaceae bacterium]